MKIPTGLAASILLAAPCCFAANSNYTIYSFKGGSGSGRNPEAPLVVGHDGALYGTTVGPENLQCRGGCGNVFRITPPGSPGQPWLETALYSFKGQPDGASPFIGSLAIGKNGALFGTTLLGGNSCPTINSTCGTVFELTRTDSPDVWTETVLYRFTAVAGDGGNSYGGLVIGANGALFGTTGFGGAWGAGTVFELNPPAAPGGAWTEKILYSFGGKPNDGTLPQSGLTPAPNDAFFGTTSQGGAAGNGVVFQLTPPQPGGSWTETIVDNFTGISRFPQAGLTMGHDGLLYGAAKYGGDFSSPCAGAGCGTIYQLAPPAAPGAGWTETLVYTFTGAADGAWPTSPVVIGQGGALYGVSDTSVFKLTPPAIAGNAWAYLNRHAFTGTGGDGQDPFGLAIRGTGQFSDTLFGVTFLGGYGACDCGTVFAIPQ